MVSGLIVVVSCADATFLNTRLSLEAKFVQRLETSSRWRREACPRDRAESNAILAADRILEDNQLEPSVCRADD